MKMSRTDKAYLISDIHGNMDKCCKIFEYIIKNPCAALFVCGDICGIRCDKDNEFLLSFSDMMRNLKIEMQDLYPSVFLILGNDDPVTIEKRIRELEKEGLIKYMSSRCIEWNGFKICGYSFIPPSPFLLKDWEKYDVSRFTDPGSIPLENGFYTKDPEPERFTVSTISDDLDNLNRNNKSALPLILMTHVPPYNTSLDFADLKGKIIDHVKPDEHIGSIALRRFIEKNQPFITMHGHVHESYRLTGKWKEKINNTFIFSAASESGDVRIGEINLQNPDLSTLIFL